MEREGLKVLVTRKPLANHGVPGGAGYFNHAEFYGYSPYMKPSKFGQTT
jgi:hypothetical protein